MSIIYIAFIECVLRPKHDWFVVYGFPQMNDPRTDGLYKTLSHEAEAGLVDIKNDRRYFRFKRDEEVRIVNNVVVFDDEWVEELAIDELNNSLKRKELMSRC
jgi:hypothetical protein